MDTNETAQPPALDTWVDPCSDAGDGFCMACGFEVPR